MSRLAEFDRLMDAGAYGEAFDVLMPSPRCKFNFTPYWPPQHFELSDPNGRNGEWHATIRLSHEIVEHDGLAVPAFEGDVERLEWEAAHEQRRRG